MGYTFKTVDHEPVIITEDKDEFHRETNVLFDETLYCVPIGEKYELNGSVYIRISVPEFNKLAGIGVPDTHLAGPGWTGQDISMEAKRNKALAKNPMHTTMNDYKMSNPDSIPSKALEKNKKKMAKKNVKVAKNATEGI